MKETVCNFGPNVHRVGPFRVHVDIARQLAAKGFSTLRLDLSGLGDSAARTGKYEIEDRALLDVNDAMDFLQEETGVNRFTLLGLCSGAYNAHCVAVKDERIVGSVFMDGIVFRTAGYHIRRFLSFFRFRFWRNAIKRRLMKSTSDIDSLMKRNVQMLFLYTDGYDDIVGRQQFQEMYGLRPDDGQLQVEYYPKSEHTFRLIENRRAACNRITDWVANQFGSPAV